MVQLALKSFLSITNKLLSLSDYKYDISKAFRNDFDPNFIEEIKTDDAQFQQLFEKEMNNFDSPTFFIDSRPSVGWLCWGKSMKVVKSMQFEVNLKDDDKMLLSDMGRYISLDWLKNICSDLIHANETRGIFRSSNVSLFNFVLLLISKGFSELKLSDILGLCEELYKSCLLYTSRCV